MARTYRKIIAGKKLRQPRHRWKLLAGASAHSIVDDWSEKPIAARREQHGLKRGFTERFPEGYNGPTPRIYRPDGR